MYKNDIKNFDFVPNTVDGKNTLMVTITLKDHASWPKEAIYSHLNLENPYHSKDAYYRIRDNSLIFEVVNVGFENIAIPSATFNSENLTKSLNSSLNDLQTNDNQLTKGQKTRLFDSLSEIDNNFVPSSINIEKTSVTYTKSNNAPLNLFATNSSSTQKQDYNFNFNIQADNGFVLVDDNDKYMTNYEIYNIIFNIVNVTLS